MTRRQFRPMSLGQECANLTNQETHADSTYEQYIDERTDAKFEHRQQADHAARQADADKAAQDTAAASAQAVLAENSTRMGEFEAQHPTFTETLKASQSPMTPVMEETMMRSTIGPALAMFVAEHPEEATRIAQIPDTFAQAIEIVRLEAHPDVVAREAGHPADPDGGQDRVPVVENPYALPLKTVKAPRDLQPRLAPGATNCSTARSSTR